MADEVDISTDAILDAPGIRAAAIRANLQGDGQDECEDCLAIIAKLTAMYREKKYVVVSLRPEQVESRLADMIHEDAGGRDGWGKRHG